MSVHVRTVVTCTLFPQDIKRFSLPKVISLDVGVPADKKPSPREQLSNQVANIFEMQRQAQQVSYMQSD